MSLLRNRAAGHARVGYAELFFDLVFVFAITQISHMLLADLSLLGALRTAVLFLAVWWVWNYTAWVTNWLDPDRRGVRLLLFALMAVGLVLSIALPRAYADAGLVFATAYAAMQLGRSLFMWSTLRTQSPENAMNFARISVWLGISGCIWIAGGLATTWRLSLWAIAILIEYASPLFAFRVPGLGQSVTSSWDIESAHLAERCALFVIIVFGEVILMSAATYADHAVETAAAGAFALAFIATLALWWLYFAAAAERASLRFAGADDVGALARSAYTYLHVPIVAGLIAFAAGVERLIAHPDGHLDRATAMLLFGGPILYLIGLAGFRQAVKIGLGASHTLAAVLLAGIILFADALTPTLGAGLVAATLLVIAILEDRVDERDKERVHAAH